MGCTKEPAPTRLDYVYVHRTNYNRGIFVVLSSLSYAISRLRLGPGATLCTDTDSSVF